MKIAGIEYIEYTPTEGIPTDCANSGESPASKLFSLAMVAPDRGFDFWAAFHVSALRLALEECRWN